MPLWGRNDEAMAAPSNQIIAGNAANGYVMFPTLQQTRLLSTILPMVLIQHNRMLQLVCSVLMLRKNK